jgi:hypothetical protein
MDESCASDQAHAVVTTANHHHDQLTAEHLHESRDIGSEVLNKSMPLSAQICSSSGSSCSCSMQPDDAPKPNPKTPYLLQNFNPLALLTSHHQQLRPDVIGVEYHHEIGPSLDQIPPSNSLRQALLSVWRT